MYSNVSETFSLWENQTVTLESCLRLVGSHMMGIASLLTVTPPLPGCHPTSKRFKQVEKLLVCTRPQPFTGHDVCGVTALARTQFGLPKSL